MPKVSIIVPTYNVEMYLRECMESIVNQTLTDLEVICINDGSKDHSLDILMEYAWRDSRITVVDKENGGYGIGMNIGLDRATGEYIGIVEPDDYVSISMFENLYNKAVEEDLDFVKADFYRFKHDEDGKLEFALNQLSKNPEDYNVVFNPSEQPETLNYIMNTWSGIYKRSFLEAHHIRHNETPGASFQDNGFWFQTFIYAKRAMILNVPYYRNRRDNPNSSVKDRQKVYCMNVEYDHIRDILMRDPAIWEKFKGMYYYKKYGNYMNTLRRIAPEMREEYTHRFADEFKRALDRSEISKEDFPATSWDNITMMTSNWKLFYHQKILTPATERKLKSQVDSLKSRNKKLEAENKKLKKQMSKIKKSFSFRLGRFITFIPRKIKKLFKR